MKLFLIASFGLFISVHSLASVTEQVVSIETGTGKLAGTILTND